MVDREVQAWGPTSTAPNGSMRKANTATPSPAMTAHAIGFAIYELEWDNIRLRSADR